MKKYVDKDALQDFATKLHTKQKTIFATKNEVGTPLVASLVADMTDTDKIYVYVGSESGYTAGNWYYYNGSAWTSGGVYNSAAVQTDDTLSVEGMAADAKATGDAISAIEDDLIEIDATLSQSGKAADAAAVGTAIASIEIEVDATLTQAGMAADAKAAGDEISDLKNEIEILDNAVFDYDELVIDINSDILTFKNGYYAGLTGWVESSPYKSYYFTAETEFQCYIEQMPWNYFSICLYKDGEVNQANFIARYRKDGSSEYTLPTIDNQLTVPAGYVFVISTTTGVTSFEIFTSIITNTYDKISELQEQSLVKIKKESNKITITQKNLVYEFMRDTLASINLDTWRIRNYSIGSIRYENMEIEGVLKQQNTADFVGGYHGDEKYSSIAIYVDGEQIAENAIISEKYAKRVTIFVESDVYFCNTSDKAFTRYKQLDFFDNILRITNKWVYVGASSFIVQRYPCGMFSMNTADMYGYATNFTPYLQNSIEAPSKQSIDKVEFYGDGFTVCVKYTGEKDKTYYRGTASYFGSENPPRMKAYLMGIYEYQSTRTLATNDTIESEVELSIY